MKPDELERIGAGIWGEQWKAPMSRALGITVRWLRAYNDGEAAIPRATELAIYYLEERPILARSLGAEGLKRGARPPAEPE